MKKSVPVTVFGLVLVISAMADNYKILKLNTPTINISGRICQEGDMFSDRDVISWSKDGQAFKAQNTTSKIIRLFSEVEFKRNGVNTIEDFFLRTSYLSTRTMGFGGLEEYLEDDFRLFDSICVESIVKADSQHYFRATYNYNGETIIKKLRGIGNSFVIDRSLFPANNSVSEFVLSMSFVNEESNDEYLLTDSMRIILLPLSNGTTK